MDLPNYQLENKYGLINSSGNQLEIHASQQKENENKEVLTKAIKQVANKNIKQISEWQKQNPKYKDPESKQNDKYMQIVLNSMSGSTNEEANKNYEKIIKNVIKETVIDKCL